MDKNPAALWQELVKNGFGMFLYIQNGGWFWLKGNATAFNGLVPVYFVAATLITGFFVWSEIRKSRELQVSQA